MDAGNHRPRRAWRGAAGILVTVAGMAACGESGDGGAALAPAGVVPPSAQRTGDPAAGYDTLVNGGYVTCGIPYAAWRRSATEAGPGPSLPGRNAANDELPYYLSLYRNEDGVDLVTTNCLLCHGGLFDGEPVIGLGNESLDFTGDPRRTITAVGNYVSGAAETEAWREWGRRIAAIASYMITDTVGVNPATNLTLALIAHRAPDTLAWSDTPLIEPPPQRPLPVSVPPWWRMARKHAMFYNAMGRGDHARYMMMKSLVCADGLDDVRAVDDLFTDVRAYIASLEPPAYPYPVDRELAEEGADTFAQHCASCHGTYGPEGAYPNLVVDLETVGTDPAYANQAYQSGERFMRWFNRSWFGELATARPAPGYIAPPLDGVWITAPFLHNGSVPTIMALLDSEQRPRYWTRNFAEQEFDTEELGWRYTALSYGKQGAADSAERKRIYDTTQPGYSNQGHTFGDTLTRAERRALVEYLKTL